MPAEVGRGDQAGGQAADDERAGAEAHEQHAGGEAPLVREARHDGAYNAVVHEAHAEARNGKGAVEQPQPVGLQEHTEHISREREHPARRYGKAHAEPRGDGPADDSAQAETCQHDGKAHAQLLARPAEARPEGH